jgi:hypothetical protein
VGAVSRYRKKPVVIEAVQFTGENFAELAAFCGSHPDSSGHLEIATFNRIGTYLLDDKPGVLGELWVAANGAWLGLVQGEWVIHDSLGFYPCKPDVFEATYEAVQ